MMQDDYISISALQHYAFCPRQFALIHIEQAWEENHFTAEGKVLHERVDSCAAETRGAIRYERSVLLVSEQFHIHGKMDLLEVETLSNDEVKYLPVEYKRGKHKVEDWDRIQVCAQALCLEEMRSIAVKEGAIWYWEERRRERFIIDEKLREVTKAVIYDARNLLLSNVTPAPTTRRSRCKACSLMDVCKPNIFQADCTRSHIESLFSYNVTAISRGCDR